jgi:hypothetical protein
MRRALVAGLFAWGCGGGGGGARDGGTDGLGPDAATSQTLGVQLLVNVVADPALANDDQPVDYRVTVRDGAGNTVDDATVRAGRMGETMALTGSGGGVYQASSPGWAPRFEVSVERGADFLTGATVPSPSLFSISLEPDPPRRATAAEARWTPNMEPGVMAQVVVTLVGAGITHAGVNGRDDGLEPLDGATFPGASDYLVAVTRSTSETFDSPESMALVQVMVRRMITVTE